MSPAVPTPSRAARNRLSGSGSTVSPSADIGG